MKHRPKLKFVDSTKALGELRLLREAGAIADRVMEQIITRIVPGMREIEVVEELKHLWTKEGANEVLFHPIIGAGSNGASPHHQSDQSVIKSGDMVVIDTGAVSSHYCSDMTRTIVICEAAPQMKEVYEVVCRAQAPRR